MVYSGDLGYFGVWKSVYTWCYLMFVVILARVGRALVGWGKSASILWKNYSWRLFLFWPSMRHVQLWVGLWLLGTLKGHGMQVLPFTNQWNFNMFVKKPWIFLLAIVEIGFSGPQESILKYAAQKYTHFHKKNASH